MKIKKQEAQKSMSKKKRKLKLEDYKSCFEGAQIENKTNHLEKNQIYGDSVKEDHQEYIKTNKLILKIQRRFRSEKQNVFTKEINEIAQKFK